MDATAVEAQESGESGSLIFSHGWSLGGKGLDLVFRAEQGQMTGHGQRAAGLRMSWGIPVPVIAHAVVNEWVLRPGRPRHNYDRMGDAPAIRC